MGWVNEPEEFILASCWNMYHLSLNGGNDMNLIFFRVIVMIFCIAVGTENVMATPMISMDMDALTSGIQSNISIDPGDRFVASIVLTGDGVTRFDTVALDVAFNDGGGQIANLQDARILTTFPIDSDFAPQNPVIGSGIDGAEDLFCSQQQNRLCAPTTFGDEISRGGSAAPAGFADSLGGVAFGSSVENPFSTRVLGNGESIDLLFLGFQDAGLGGSNTFLVGGALLAQNSTKMFSFSLTQNPALFLDGNPIEATFVSGQATTVPEPTAALLFSSGLAGLVFWRWKKKDEQLKRSKENLNS